MIQLRDTFKSFSEKRAGGWLLGIAFLLTAILYWPGLTGDFLFDDYPNIVDNADLHPHNASFPALLNAALSSPASDFKRPLASLSFAANYLATGLDPYWMKLTNLVIHLLNGWLVYLLACQLLLVAAGKKDKLTLNASSSIAPDRSSKLRRIYLVAALIAAGWMVLPINLTAVLYTVQRMESMANLFVLLGLLGYVIGRRRMLANGSDEPVKLPGFVLCCISVTVPVLTGILAKETVVMLPLYAILAEWILFGLKGSSGTLDKRVIWLFLFVLFLPMIMGVAWLLPHVLRPGSWQTRNFTLETRLLSELRVVVDYVAWTVLPTPQALSFYHDDFQVSAGWLTPWTTLASLIALIGMLAAIWWLRPRLPLASLGLALFLGAQLLTCTIIPLELVYEHRNYFASFGMLLAIIPLLAVPKDAFFALPRLTLLAGLGLCWCALTAMTAHAWGNPVLLAQELAERAPASPRAQYELGRTYIIYSHYNPASPFTKLVYAPLEKAATLPGSSILPEQALIFMNARMHLPLKDQWWQSMIAKLKANPVGVQDESSLGALTQCARDGSCDLPKDRMTEAYLAAITNHQPSARLLSMYADYAWNVLGDHSLGLRMAYQTTKLAPTEPAYRITLARMLIAQGQSTEADQQIDALRQLNLGGRLSSSIESLEHMQQQTQ
jgi:protein O-mannosyl-transferase